MTNPDDRDHPQGPPEAGHGSADDPRAAALIHVSGAGELLPLIPYLLQYQPSAGQVVVVAMSGLHLAVACALPATQHRPGHVWARLAQPLAHSEATDVIIIGYGDVTASPLLSRLAAASPLPVSGLLRVDGDRWWPLNPSHHTSHHTSGDTSGDISDGAGLTGHPVVGQPVAGQRVAGQRVAGHRVAGRRVGGVSSAGVGSGWPLARDSAAEVCLLAHQGSPAASRQDLVAGWRPGSHLDAPAVAALLPVDPEPAASVLWLAVSSAHEERRDGPLPIDPSQASLLLHAVSKVAIRDACALWQDDAAWWLWQDLIRLAPPGWISVTATLLGLTAYLRGAGAAAAQAMQHARGDDPTNRLAATLNWAMAQHVPPQELRALLDEVAGQQPGGPLRGPAAPGQR